MSETATRVGLGCVVMLGIGGMLAVGLPFIGCMGLGMAVESGAMPPADVVRGSQVPHEVLGELERDVLAEGESVELLSVNSLTEWIGEGSIITNRRALNYWRGTDGAVHHESVDLERVVRVHVPEASWPDDVVMEAHTQDGGLLLLSIDPTSPGPKRFEAGLRAAVAEARQQGLEEPVKAPTEVQPAVDPEPNPVPAPLPKGPRGR